MMSASETLESLNARMTAARRERDDAISERRRLGLENLKHSDSKRGAKIGSLTARIGDLNTELEDLDANRAALQREVGKEREQANEAVQQQWRDAVFALLNSIEHDCRRFDEALLVLKEVCPRIDQAMGQASWIAAKFVRSDTMQAIRPRQTDDVLWCALFGLHLLPQLADPGGRPDWMTAVSRGFAMQLRSRLAPPANEEAA